MTDREKAEAIAAALAHRGRPLTAEERLVVARILAAGTAAP